MCACFVKQLFCIDFLIIIWKFIFKYFINYCLRSLKLIQLWMLSSFFVLVSWEKNYMRWLAKHANMTCLSFLRSLVQIYSIRYLFTISNPIQPPCLSKLWYKLRTKWRNVWSIKGGNLEWFGEGVMFCPKYYIYSKHRVRLRWRRRSSDKWIVGRMRL